MNTAVIFTSVCLSLLASTANAQLTTGTKFIGGNIGYASSTLTDNSNNPSLPTSLRENERTFRRFNFNPSAGVFVAENVAIGASVGFYSSKETGSYYTGSTPDRNNVVTKGTAFFAAPFLRYYYLPTESFGIYGQLSAGYSSGRFRATDDILNSDPPIAKNREVFTYITPALVFFPVTKLGLELACGSIGYTYRRNRTEPVQQNQFATESTHSSFGANFGLSYLTLGASYYLGR